MFAALLLYVLIIAGFIGVSWVVDNLFSLIRKKYEEKPYDAFAAFLVWCSLFGSYTYFFAHLLH